MAVLGSSSVERTRLFIWDASTFHLVWNDVEPILLRDPRRWGQYYTLESLRNLPSVDNVHAWTFHDDGGCVGVLYTQLDVWPVKIVCRFLLAAALPGYGLRLVREHLEFIELWAKRSGASELEMAGRLGWLKVIPNEYKTNTVVLTKDLTGLKEH